MDIHAIREDPEFIKQNQIKRFKSSDIIDQILKVDQEWKQITHDLDQTRAIKNKISQSFKKAPVNETTNNENLLTQIIDGNLDLELLTRNQLKDIGRELNEYIQQKEELKNILMEKRDNLINLLGNVLHKDVPLSNNEDENVVIYQTDIKQNYKDNLLDHIDLGKKLEMVDTENGNLIAGNRGYFLTGMGVKLNLALINYAIDFLLQKNYKLMQTPHVVEKDLMSQITQLSEYEETLYKLEGYDKFLIATSEQPMTAYFANKNLDRKTLPIKFAGLSTCYRKETGAHGRQTRGIYRVHQYEKVEQFCVTDKDHSWEVFDEMINASKEFYDSLGLDYRVVNIVSGALNNSAAMKYDIEVWFPGSKFYGEVVSCTNCLDYFSKKINTKILGLKENVHMLNCTLMANTRTICAILETYQEESGLRVPEPLIKYIGTNFIEYP